MSILPLVTCLCPTYKRPSRLIANAIACFEAQTYPAERRRLIVLDDSGELPPQHGENWSIISVVNRYESLPAKYNSMVEMAGDADIIVVFEDDDCFAPRHIENHVRALVDNVWSHPSKAWSLYTGKLEQEPARGRLHSSLAMRREVAKWPETKQAQFDLRLLAELREKHGDPGDPCDYGLPTYVFRWGSTGTWHGQNFMRGPEDTTWYETAGKRSSPKRDGPIVPKLDEETERVYAQIEAMS